MATYKVTLRTGQSFQIDDSRALSTLSAQLAHEGFLVVQRRAGGYSQAITEVALMERTVESIEVASP